MTLNLNQFDQGKVKATLVNGHAFNVLSVRLKKDSTATFGAGSAVKVVDVASDGEIIVDKAAVADDILGFIKYNIKDNSPVKGDRVEVAMDSCIMLMEASAAIAGGAKVQIVATDDKIATQTSTNTIAGRALRKAAASGDLIPVLINTPA